MNPTCTTEDIQAIHIQEEAWHPNGHGESIERIGKHGKANFSHYECTACHIWFTQWKAVEAHLGRKVTEENR